MNPVNAANNCTQIWRVNVKDISSPSEGFRKLKSRQELIDFNNEPFTPKSMLEQPELNINFNEKQIVVLITNLKDNTTSDHLQSAEVVGEKINLVFARIFEKKEKIQQFQKVELRFFVLDKNLPVTKVCRSFITEED